MVCACIQELAKLRKSSIEAVDNTETFDSFKKYMHVSREIEDQLKEIIKSANAELNKCLIMLGGSTGDGKSHLISYLKNADEKNLLADYETYNDSTESDEPSLEFLEALAKQLEEFNDDNLDNGSSVKMIIAINLGIIGKFFDSKEGKNFTRLKDYVENNQILSSYSNEIGYKSGSIFQHISFADYQIFGISESGVYTEYLEKLLDKVFDVDEDGNEFYKTINNCVCGQKNKCPVFHNYQLLQDKKIQKYIINRIIQIVIEDKAIMSTRDVLNLLYDILVSENFSKQALIDDFSDETKYLMDYISWSAPTLINEYADISEKLRLLRRHDVFRYRTEEVDNRTMKFHSMENIEQEFRQGTKGTPYEQLADTTSIAVFGGIKPELKKQVYRFLVRLEDMNGGSVGNEHSSIFDEYVKNIFYQCTGNERKLAKFFDLAQNAILTWDGNFGDETICIDESNDMYWILEALMIENASLGVRPSSDEVLYRFSPELRVRFKSQFIADQDALETSVDFSLFELLCAMKNGYKPNVKDKNLHTDFISYIKRLTDLGNKGRRVIIQSKSGDMKRRYSFEKTTAGYKFKVI